MTYRLSVLITLIAFIFPFQLLAAGMELTGEVVLEKGKAPMPTSFTKTHDNGFIVVGTTEHGTQTTDPDGSSSKAMAIKTDTKGNVIWRYVVSDSVDLNGNKIKYARMNPIYSSAVEMKDGSIFVCGTVPSGDKTFGQLTHLDKNGKLIDKQSILPVGFETSGFDSCIAWGDGFAAVGYVFKTEPKKTLEETFKDGKLPYDQHFSHLIAYINKDGHQIWAKTTPLTTFVPAYSNNLNPLQIVSDGGFIFAKRSDSKRTQIIHVKLDGKIVSQVIQGKFMLALPVNGETDIQLVSTEDSYPLARIKLNDDLQKTGRELEKSQLEAYTRNMAYRLPDQSLVIFGSIYGVGKFPHEQSAGLIKLDSTMQHVTTLSISPEQYSAYINFAFPISNSGEFVSERWVNPFYRQEELIKLIQSPEFQKSDLTQRKKIGLEWESEATKRSGLALDFVRVK